MKIRVKDEKGFKHKNNKCNTALIVVVFHQKVFCLIQLQFCFCFSEHKINIINSVSPRLMALGGQGGGGVLFFSNIKTFI